MVFSDDNDQKTASSDGIYWGGPGDGYTGASLDLPCMPIDFTLCTSYMVEAWTTDFTYADLVQLQYFDGYFYFTWALVRMSASSSDTTFQVKLGKVNFKRSTGKVLFPLTWTHVCLSLDTGSGRVQMAVDGKLIEDAVHQEALEEDETRPTSLKMILGYFEDGFKGVEFTGKLSLINMFSSPLATKTMVAMTQAGFGWKCGAPGDFISWEEADWQLWHSTRIEMVEGLTHPCRRESQVTLYPADFQSHSSCMKHCKKLGAARIPPVQTREEWDKLKEQIHFSHPSLEYLPKLWLAATDEESEEEWRDSYPPFELLDIGGTRPWYSSSLADREHGTEYNCLQWHYNTITLDDNRVWKETGCTGANDVGCPCQYKRQPILLLRGLCQETLLDRLYTPKQHVQDWFSPPVVIIMGLTTSRIHYSDTSGHWELTVAESKVTAVSDTTKLSYALGLHKWTVKNDVCNNEKPYTVHLKLTGCSREGEFTCDNGQCVTMEERCDQFSDCDDESDEVDCNILVFKNNYNKRIPPVTSSNTMKRTMVPVQVNISITLFKILDMIETHHTIDFQFEITLEWRENRVVYQNLKKESSMNALSTNDIQQLWLPNVIYDNTDQKEMTRLGALWEWVTPVTVIREEDYSKRSGPEEVHEIEIFNGEENRLMMQQIYTHQFQCVYQLQLYPFDTQVTIKVTPSDLVF